MSTSTTSPVIMGPSEATALLGIPVPALVALIRRGKYLFTEIAPRQLRTMVEDCITRHIEPRALTVMRDVETYERATLARWIGDLNERA